MERAKGERAVEIERASHEPCDGARRPTAEGENRKREREPRARPRKMGPRAGAGAGATRIGATAKSTPPGKRKCSSAFTKSKTPYSGIRGREEQMAIWRGEIYSGTIERGLFPVNGDNKWNGHGNENWLIV